MKMAFIIAVIIAAITSLFGIILIASFLSIKKAYIAFVSKHSILLSIQKDVNYKYTFYPFINHDQEYTYDNEDFYNEISEEDYLIYKLQTLSSELIKQIRLMNYNKEAFIKYKNSLNSINEKGKYDKNTKGFIVKLLNHYEKKLFIKNTKSPAIEYTINISLFLSTLHGEVYRQKCQKFASSEILKLIERYKNKSGNFYKDRGIWDSICRVERGFVSNKIRFKIYERDGYRCRYCHKTQLEAALEIDHIIPIAKGGKSTMNNLQTLCHNCNKEKSDSKNRMF